MSVDRTAITVATRSLLRGLHQNLHRQGLRETPARVAKFWEEFLQPEDFKYTSFDSDGMDEMIVESDIPFVSVCEHHLLPFFGVATVGYVPDGKIVGLSKLARAVQFRARALQNQERITLEVARDLERAISPRGVGVVLRARHLCMEMRGIKASGVWTTTSRMTGVFRNSGACRSEFLALARKGGE